MFIIVTFNIYVDLVPFMLTDLVTKTFKVVIEFNEEFKPEYEDLENPTTIDMVSEVKDAVSGILWHELNMMYLWFVTYVLRTDFTNGILFGDFFPKLLLTLLSGVRSIQNGEKTERNAIMWSLFIVLHVVLIL